MQFKVQVPVWLAMAVSLVLLGAGALLQAATTVNLPNGQYLVVDPDYDAGSVQNVGRVRVYSSGGSLITTVQGSTTNDQVGSGGVVALGTSRYVICSPQWDNGAIVDAGAITYGYEGLMFLGPIASGGATWAGTTANDQVGGGGITKMGTNLCMVRSPLWDNGAAVNAGAITFISGDNVFYSTGAIAASNSLVGGSTEDQIGSGGITAVGTTLYLVSSPLWDNGAAIDAGAVTPVFTSSSFWAGELSASNSLVGTTAGDRISSGGITVVGADLYLVRSPLWDNGAVADAGAVSPAYSTSARIGAVSATNSLIGTTAGDQISSGGITVIGTELYLVRSPLWDNGAAANAGAVSPAYVSSARIGAVSASNSLIGTTAGDQIGSGGVTTLGTELYIVRSPLWDNGTATDAGAVSPAYVSSARIGAVSASNSLIGTTANDQIGSGGVTIIGSDTYLVSSPQWDNGSIINAGAVMAVNIGFVRVGAITPQNAWVGGTANDQVGSGGVTAIGTSAYLIHSPLWDHSVAVDAGAVSYGTTTNGNYGLVSLSNSLVGSHANDQIGSGGITVQGSTGFTISSPNWCYGAGATTTGSTSVWIAGVVSSSNSTVGAESAVPEISLLQPAPTEVASNGSRDYGSVTLGGTHGLTFVIRNTGADDLRLTGTTRVARSGTDAALFSVAGQPPALIVAGDSASFTVNFTPTSEGAKTAQISIANNDSNENPYRVNLTATALSQVAGWRQTHFGSSANTGSAADDADYDKDGIPNLVEYALGLHPGQSTAAQLPLPATNGGNFGLSFNEPAGISGITYGAEWSTSLATGSWLPVTDTGTPPQHLFSVPTAGNLQIFMRLKIMAAP